MTDMDATGRPIPQHNLRCGLVASEGRVGDDLNVLAQRDNVGSTDGLVLERGDAIAPR